jgi:ABC-type transporter MlaC component
LPLPNVNGEWIVYDAAIDSVSLMKNFRERFSAGHFKIVDPRAAHEN